MFPAGDLDLVVGERGEGVFGGFLNYFENTGTSTAPAFVQRTGSANPFGAPGGAHVKPAFADLDGDGMLRPRPSIDKL